MAYQIDEKDRSILSAIDFRARDSLAEIAGELGESKQFLDYRLKNLEKSGVLGGFFPVINCFLFGYFYCRILLRFSGLPSPVRKSLYQYITRHPRLVWGYELSGEYDLILVFWCVSIEEFETILRDFMLQFGAHVTGRQEHIVTNLTHLSNIYYAPKRKRLLHHLRGAGRSVHIDRLEHEVLSALSNDARSSAAAIGEKLGVTGKVVSARIRRLEEEGVLACYRPIVDWGRSGLTFFKVFVRLQPHRQAEFEQFCNYLYTQPQVLFVINGIGIGADLDIEVLASSHDEFVACMDRFRQRFAGLITGYSYIVLTKLLRVSYYPAALVGEHIQRHDRYGSS